MRLFGLLSGVRNRIRSHRHHNRQKTMRLSDEGIDLIAACTAGGRIDTKVQWTVSILLADAGTVSGALCVIAV
jgi:hypothetical protein